MELLNWAEGNMMTVLAGMSEEVDDEDIKDRTHEMFLKCSHYQFKQFKFW